MINVSSPNATAANGIQVVFHGPLESRPLINVQFGDPNYLETKTGPATIGGGDNDFWNQLTYDPKSGDESGLPDAATVNCLDNHGNPTSAQVTFYTVDPGASHFINFANDPLLDGCILSGGGEDWHLYISLPSGTYDIYLYAAALGCRAQYLGSTFQITSGIVGVSDYSGYVKSTSTAWYNINTYTEGNQYVVFRNIQVDASTPLVVNVSSSNATAANGIQILLDSSP